MKIVSAALAGLAAAGVAAAGLAGAALRLATSAPACAALFTLLGAALIVCGVDMIWGRGAALIVGGVMLNALAALIAWGMKA
jgi:hypothetical protein